MTPSEKSPHVAAVGMLRSQPSVAQTIPLALGDNFRGFRIVGTEAAYAALYGAKLVDGRMFEQPMEAVIGSAVAQGTGAELGQRMAGTHGLGGGAQDHAQAPLIVVGQLKQTGTVIDRLILTPVESVWRVHGIPAEQGRADGEPHGHALPDAGERPEMQPEVTAILVRYRTALGAVQLPGFINRQKDLQAAVPAVELARAPSHCFPNCTTLACQPCGSIRRKR